MSNLVEQIRNLLSLLETADDDIWIHHAARETAENLISRRKSLRRSTSPGTVIISSRIPEDPHLKKLLYTVVISISKSLEDAHPDALAYTSKAVFRNVGGSTLYDPLSKDRKEFVEPVIEIPWKKFFSGELDDDLPTILAHEMRHALDELKRVDHEKGTVKKSKSYFQPRVPDEESSSPAEINAVYQELVRNIATDIENRIESNRVMTNPEKISMIDDYMHWLRFEEYFPMGQNDPGFKRIRIRAFKLIDRLLQEK